MPSALSSPGSRTALRVVKGLARHGRGPRPHAGVATGLAILAASCVVAVPAAATSAVRTVKLSDERTLSRWAMPMTEANVRARAQQGARTIAHLHYLTEDRQPERYLVLAARIDHRGRRWLQVRLPMRPNGRKGWVARESLGPLHKVTQLLVINRATLRATLYRDGKRIWRAPVGVGRPSMPTPAGRFYAREKLRSLSTVYGPVAIGTSAYSTLSDWPGGGVVGIHGTDEPGLIPGRPSHGCVRLHNADILRRARLMPVGTPIRII